MEKQSKLAPQQSTRPGAGRRFVRRSKNSNEKVRGNNGRNVDHYEVDNAWAVVFSGARHGRIDKGVARWKVGCLSTLAIHTVIP